jgi:hypothetical protein
MEPHRQDLTGNYPFRVRMTLLDSMFINTLHKENIPEICMEQWKKLQYNDCYKLAGNKECF